MKEVIAALLERTAYGYAFVDSAPGAQREGPVRVFLIKRGSASDASGRVTAQRLFAHSELLVPGHPVEQLSPPDESALKQQRAVDAVFDACKAQACDTS